MYKLLQIYCSGNLLIVANSLRHNYEIIISKLDLKPVSNLVSNHHLFIIPGAYALGSIDPSLYRISDEDDDYEIPPEHLGRVWFAVEYERETEKLLVTLIKAKNLPSRMFGASNGCDPFVRYVILIN